jgi:hypothetical protein
VEIAPVPVYGRAYRRREPQGRSLVPEPVDHDGMVERLRGLSDGELRALGRAVRQVEAERSRPTGRAPRRAPPRRAQDGLASGPVERSFDPLSLFAALVMALAVAGLLFLVWQLARARHGFADVRPAPPAIAADPERQAGFIVVGA